MDLRKDFLQKLEIDDSMEWITVINSSSSKFFEWMQDNLEDSNFLTLQEVQE